MNRIKELRTKRGIKQSDLCKQLGVTQGSLSGWETGRYEPDLSAIKKMAEMFDVSVDYLIGRDETADERKTKGYFVPVLGRVAAGLPLFADEEILDYEELPLEWKKKGEYFGLTIKGQSMEPRICDGDVVIVRQQEDCNNGDVAIVMVNGDEATCKRVQKSDDGITLISNNPMFPPQFYTAKQIDTLPVKIIGVVAELRGKF